MLWKSAPKITKPVRSGGEPINTTIKGNGQQLETVSRTRQVHIDALISQEDLTLEMHARGWGCSSTLTNC